jgi:hypothetical protein
MLAARQHNVLYLVLAMIRPVPILTLIVILAGIVNAQELRLPAKVDLAAEFGKLGIPPLSQGGRNTCSLFAVAGIADFERARSGAGGERLSVEFLTWAANEAAGLRGDQAMFYEAVHGLNTLGICSAEQMPYEPAGDARRRPNERSLSDAKKLSASWQVQWIKRWDVTRGLAEPELLAIKNALASGHPVACGLRWPKRTKGAEIRDVPPPEQVFDGHSIVFTGYEDDAANSQEGLLQFRNSAGEQWGNKGYGVMSYSYARAYANDAFWLRLGEPGSETPLERFEAESITVLSKTNCEAAPQRLGRRRQSMWSQGTHLLCQAQEGGSIDLAIHAAKAGRYRLRILATAAPDFGTIRASLDGKALPGDFDLYSGRLSPAGSLELGEHELAAGEHRIALSVAGKNAASTNYWFGLDAIDLLTPSK